MAQDKRLHATKGRIKIYDKKSRYIKTSGNFGKVFGNLRKMLGNLRKMFGNFQKTFGSGNFKNSSQIFINVREILENVRETYENFEKTSQKGGLGSFLERGTRVFTGKEDDLETSKIVLKFSEMFEKFGNFRKLRNLFSKLPGSGFWVFPEKGVWDLSWKEGWKTIDKFYRSFPEVLRTFFDVFWTFHFIMPDLLPQAIFCRRLSFAHGDLLS